MSTTSKPVIVEMSDDTRRAIETLESLAEADIPKLPELLFRQHLLPLLLDTDSGSVSLVPWCAQSMWWMVPARSCSGSQP